MRALTGTPFYPAAGRAEAGMPGPGPGGEGQQAGPDQPAAGLPGGARWGRGGWVRGVGGRPAGLRAALARSCGGDGRGAELFAAGVGLPARTIPRDIAEVIGCSAYSAVLSSSRRRSERGRCAGRRNRGKSPPGSAVAGAGPLVCLAACVLGTEQHRGRACFQAPVSFLAGSEPAVWYGKGSQPPREPAEHAVEVSDRAWVAAGLERGCSVPVECDLHCVAPCFCHGLSSKRGWSAVRFERGDVRGGCWGASLKQQSLLGGGDPAWESARCLKHQRGPIPVASGPLPPGRPEPQGTRRRCPKSFGEARGGPYRLGAGGERCVAPTFSAVAARGLESVSGESLSAPCRARVFIPRQRLWESKPRACVRPRRRSGPAGWGRERVGLLLAAHLASAGRVRRVTQGALAVSRLSCGRVPFEPARAPGTGRCPRCGVALVLSRPQYSLSDCLPPP